MTPTFPRIAQQLRELADALAAQGDSSPVHWKRQRVYRAAINRLLQSAAEQGAFKADPRLHMLIQPDGYRNNCLDTLVYSWYHPRMHASLRVWPLPEEQATQFVLNTLIRMLETGEQPYTNRPPSRWKRKQWQRNHYQRAQFRPLSMPDHPPTEYRSLAAALSAPHTVTRLFLRDQHLQTLPPEIGALTHLRYLTADVNALTSLPDELGALMRLRSLDLSRNRLPMLPDTIGNLQALEYLSLWRNRLTTLPASLGELQQLRCLNLLWNRLERLPATLANLTNLIELDLSGNPLIEFPLDIIRRLPRLEVLAWSSPTVHTFPDEIRELRRIKHIHLRGNFPEAVGRQLRELLPHAVILPARA